MIARSSLNKLGRLFPASLQYKIFNSPFMMRHVLRQSRFGGELEERIIELFSNRRDPGWFIEIGANDGLTQSNTKHLELFKGWQGLLVEPIPANHLRQSVTRLSSTHKVRAACVPPDFNEEVVELVYANLMTTALSLENEKDPWQHTAKGMEHARQEAYVFEAPAKTLDEILHAVGAPNSIDLFTLDVEGAELDVLRGVNFDKYRFDNLVVEDDNPGAIREYLESKGYQLRRQLTHHDYLFVPSE